MDLTDRELLELAAKAVGIAQHDIDLDGLEPEKWNPLTDDGDALRLAVAQTIRPRWIKGTVMVSFPNPDENFNFEKTLCEPVLGDDYVTATRRAIVRAAAEMGKNMK